MHKRKKVPLVLQVEQGEGGAAALAMILQYWGKTVALEQLVLECGAGDRLTSARDLVHTATRHGLYAAGYQVDMEQLGTLPLPLVAHWNQKHFVVIVARKKRGYIIHDPWKGTQFLSFAEIQQAFSGVVLYMSPAETFLPDEQPNKLKTVLKYISKNSKPASGSVVLCSFFILILHLINFVYLKLIVDGFMSGTSETAQLISGIMALQALVQLLLFKVQKSICHTMYQNTRLEFAQKCERSNIPISFITLRGAYYIEHSLKQGDDALSTVAQILIPKLLFIVGSLLYLVIMSLYHPLFALLFLALLAGWIFVRHVLLQPTHMGKSDCVEAKMVSATMQVLLDTDGDSINQQAQYRTASFHRFMNQNKGCDNRRLFDLGMCTLIISIQFLCGLAWIQRDHLTFSQLIPFMYLEILVLYSFMQLLAFPTQSGKLESIFRKISVLFPQPSKHSSKEAVVSGLLEWKNVSYRPYEAGANLYENITFRLRPGITAILTDEDSLFVELCTGQKQITAGTIYYGETSLRKLSFEALDDTVIALAGVIGHLELSIADFLRRRATDISDMTAIKLANELELHTLIMEAGGYQAKVDALSDCGKLLLSVASAMLVQPKLLILDHILQYLDEKQEQVVIQAIKRRNIDCILLLDYDSLPPNVDRVMELQKDHVEFNGTLNEFRSKVGSD